VSNVYPDVNASAACVRTNSIVHGLASLGTTNVVDDDDDNHERSKNNNNNPNRVYYATSVNLDIDEERMNTDPFGNNAAIRIVHLPPNRSDRMEDIFSDTNDDITKKDADINCIDGNGNDDSNDDNDDSDNDAVVDNNIDLVVFDRFFMEEAHSFRFRQNFPSAALVLDMQDMHSLRWGRQKIVQKWDEQQQHQQSDPFGCLPEVLGYVPSVSMDIDSRDDDDRLTRELASIHRSDLVLVCSPDELHLLKTVYRVPEEKLCLASFFVDDDGGDHTEDDCQKHYHPTETATMASPPDDNDNDPPPRFVFCGGFKHAPNADAVRLLIDRVWPKLRAELPEATLHIYGAFCPDHLLQINGNNNANCKNKYKHNHEQEHTRGITVHGFEPDLTDIFGNNKDNNNNILLAPLRFGAGIKGKIVDAWTFGMPVVTTPIGSEGMTTTMPIHLNENQNENENDGDDDGDDGDDDNGPVVLREREASLVFGGRIASTLEDFCANAIELAKNPVAYREAQTNGRILVKTLFSSRKNWGRVRDRLLQMVTDNPNDNSSNNNCNSFLVEKRKGDYTQAMLWHQSMRSTEYFSRWVELKENIRRKEKRK